MRSRRGAEMWTIKEHETLRNTKVTIHESEPDDWHWHLAIVLVTFKNPYLPIWNVTSVVIEDYE